MKNTSSSSWTVWHLRRGLDRRFRSGHPWVYSNELAESPKGLEPGAPVELRDSSGKLLARGYGNPKSLIAFRVLSRDPNEADPRSSDYLLRVFKRSAQLRIQQGFKDVSYRLCFGEADEIPGLVMDRYRLDSGQVFVIQAHTAGIHQMIPQVLEALQNYSLGQKEGPTWEQTSIVLRNDLSVRKLEGLDEENPQVVRQAPKVNLSDAQIKVAAVLGGKPLTFRVDLIKGQKTGFFLDQFANIQLSAQRLKSWVEYLKSQQSTLKKFRILDLCCYVGQWGAQLARVVREAGLEVEVVAVDASQQALSLARQNIEAEGARCEVIKGDVLKDLAQIPSSSFDLVISDPPALIKSRKDIPTGTHAYLQLATQVFRMVKDGGGVVCCSCSALLEEESFTQALSKGAQRNQTQVHWVGRGSQSPDHPMLTQFPEGRYLKGWVGFVKKA